jgi:hypothetical protein
MKSLDQNLSLSQKDINKYQNDIDDISPSSNLLLSSAKKRNSKLNKKPPNKSNNENNENNENDENNDNHNDNNNNVNENLKSISSYSKNEDISSLTPKVVVDEKELNNIIYNYRINLLISFFRKFKVLKENSHKIISVKKNLREKRDLIIPEGDGDLDVDLFPEETYNYIGNIFINKKDGFGIQIFPNTNSKYIGYFMNDKRVNYCKFEDKSKLYSYLGETNNNFTGHYGIYFNYKIGINYEGEWKNNRKDGIGYEQYQDGSCYEGEFRKGLKHGIGAYFWKDGSQYIGQFNNNALEGYGTYKFKDGSFCSGLWISNQMNGFGMFTYPDVKNYLGFFKNDQKSGLGLILWIKKRKAYIGYWKNNQQNGLGKIISEEKAKYGFWEEGNRIIKYNENEFYNLLEEQKTSQIITHIFNMNYDQLNTYINYMTNI